jgi:hypothetical protein
MLRHFRLPALRGFKTGSITINKSEAHGFGERERSKKVLYVMVFHNRRGMQVVTFIPNRWLSVCFRHIFPMPHR